LNKIDLVAKDYAEIQGREYQAIALSALDAETFGPFLDAAQKTIGRLGLLKTSAKQTSAN
jgi:hypothetical protein